jgi:hypothetical protein
MTIQEIVTPKTLDLGNIRNILLIAAESRHSCPVRPSKPRLASVQPSAKDTEHYSIGLAEFDAKVCQYNKDKIDSCAHNCLVDDAVEMFIKEETGLNALTISDKVKNNVWNMAFECNASGGYYAVYEHLQKLVNMFKE